MKVLTFPIGSFELGRHRNTVAVVFFNSAKVKTRRGRAGDDAPTTARRQLHDRTCRAGGWRRWRSGHRRRQWPTYRPAARRSRQGRSSACRAPSPAHGDWRARGRRCAGSARRPRPWLPRSSGLRPIAPTRQHQRVGEGVGIFRDIEAGGVEPVERIVAGKGLPRHAERIEAPDLALGSTCAGGDADVLTLGVDADHRAVEQQQVGDDRQRRRSAVASLTLPSGRSGNPRSLPASAHQSSRRSGRSEQIAVLVGGTPVETPGEEQDRAGKQERNVGRYLALAEDALEPGVARHQHHRRPRTAG
jgi:hypothetical protein